MKRLIQSLFMGCLFVFSIPTFARELVEYVIAAEQLNNHIARSNSIGAMPKLDDKNIASYFSILTDSAGLLDVTSNNHEKDLGYYNRVCVKTVDFMGLYIFFNPSETPISRLSSQNLLELMNKNKVNYQNELTLLNNFNIKCEAKTIPLLTIFAQNLKSNFPPEVFQVMSKSPFSFASNNFLSNLSQACSLIYGEENSSKLLTTLAELSRGYAEALQIESRHEVLAIAKAEQKKLPARFYIYLQKIIDEMSTESCEGLCALK